jgi:hypothetical protein
MTPGYVEELRRGRQIFLSHEKVQKASAFAKASARQAKEN